jgi:hypothetical protein
MPHEEKSNDIFHLNLPHVLTPIESRRIKSALETVVCITTESRDIFPFDSESGEFNHFFTQSTFLTFHSAEEHLKEALIVSKVLVNATNYKFGEALSETVSVAVGKGNTVQLALYRTTEHKCPRCWIHQSAEHATLCSRCFAVLETS